MITLIIIIITVTTPTVGGAPHAGRAPHAALQRGQRANARPNPPLLEAGMAGGAADGPPPAGVGAGGVQDHGH